MPLAILLFFLAFTAALYVLLVAVHQRVQVLQTQWLGAAHGAKPPTASAIVSRDPQSRTLFFGLLGLIAGVLCAFVLRIGVLGFAAGFALGGVVPHIVAATRQGKRRRQMDAQVVPMLNLLSNSMRGGKTLPQAIDDCARALPKPLADELTLASRHVMLGLDVEAALNALVARVKMPDIKLAVRSMLVSLRTGSDLPESMRQIAHTINERNRVTGRIRTLTTQGRMQGLILTIAPFVLLFAFRVISPAYMDVMFKTVPGNILLGAVVITQCVAFFIINKIVTVRV